MPSPWWSSMHMTKHGPDLDGVPRAKNDGDP
jgi:hypothetical protein